MATTDKHMTPGDVWSMFRQMPEMQTLVEYCYLDADVLAAATRFHESEEFNATLKIAARYHIRQGHIVDLGGGNGIASIAWAREGYSVTLLEPDPSPVVGTQALAPVLDTLNLPIAIENAVSENLPLPDQSVDIVYIRQVLHHVTSLHDTMNEVYRVLRPGGILIATREHVISRAEDLPTFLENHPVHRYTGGEHAYLLKDYTDAIERASFANIRVIAPWDSVINYAPMTQGEYRRKCYWLVRKAVRLSKFAELLVTMPLVQRVCAMYFNWRDETPGRLYSFVATRGHSRQ